ncbi:MAG: rod-binding protein [Devosia sp.]|nr:rod-binding protein [Devosia sp.]
MSNPISIFSPAGQSQDPSGRMRQQAEELEGVFLNTLMKEMFSSIDSEGDFGGGFAEETWRGMQAEQFAASMAAAGGIGLADALMADLIALQEAASKPMTNKGASN